MRNSRKQSQKTASRSNMRTKLITLFGTLFIITGAIMAWFMFSNSKNAPRFQVSVTAPAPTAFDNNINADFVGPNALPEVNNNRELGTPGELVILYEQISGDYVPALRMGADDADIGKKIKISPAIAGTWSRRGPDALVFRPAHNWPADTKFSVKVDKAVLNPDARIGTTKATFKTEPLTATVDSFNTYPAPEKKSVIGVAVVSFNYSIETKKFADRTIVRLDGDQIDFEVKFDRFHRTAVITTSPIQVTDRPQALRIKINRIPASGDDTHSKKITANTTIEAADNIFKISGMDTTVADDTDGMPRQLLLVNMTAAAAHNVKWTDYIDLYLLPAHSDNDADQDTPHRWADDEITDAVIKKATKLNAVPVDFENPAGVYQYAMSYDVSEKDTRYIYAVVRAGIPSAAGFNLKNGAARVMRVPYPTRSVKIAGSGALLALGGDRKLTITARGGADTAYVNLYKIKSTEINHLISQTYNIFGALEFKSWSFDTYDMSVVFKKRIGFANTSMKAVNYASVDLGDYLDRTHNDKTGIFVVQTGTTQSQADYSDRRLILVTDLGIVRKVNLDRSSTIFLSTLTTGAPAADTEVYVLGRNGNSVWAGRTDDNGRADIPSLPWNEYRNEKAPVAIVARNGNDVSFIPYDNAYDRRVEYSKFDIDGTYASATTALNAFLFTDRGIYRPGEAIIIGGIVKNKSFKPIPGIPVKLEMRDARGRIAFEKTFSLTADGMFDIKYSVPENAPVGEYNFQLYSLNAKNKTQDILGYSSFRVEEFTPDTMKITLNVPGADDAGWMAPEKLSASVSLHNMFAAPAPDRRISARVILTPAAFEFKEFPGYKFTDNFISGAGLAAGGAAKTITREIDDVRTDAAGNAVMDLGLADNITDNTTYSMTMVVRGFEAGTGRSVQTALRGRVSNAKYLIGWRANSDLAYINRDAARTVNLVAVDHTAARTTASDVKMRLIKRENLTSLIKDGAGYYKYQTVTRDNVVSEENITITDRGMPVNLNTTAPGNYRLQIINAAGEILANIEYFVAGDENTALESDTQAELQVKLNASSYTPGDEIAISVTAPYAGYGLITIERDKVYAYKWFRTNTTNSVQHITVPTGFEGTGYVNVSFVRDIASRDIFTTPYTYAVAPFTADAARRTINVRLSVPEKLTGDSLVVKYETNRDARIMIFAVDEGILQVARYQMPRPVAHFFKKAALQVETYQILSLILPEYKILREFAKTGGGDYNDMDGGAALAANPFARRTDAPVAFYSGIINARKGVAGDVSFNIPGSFNGTLRVFTVAAGDDGIGSADASVTVRRPVIVTMNAPAYVAPGDVFDSAAVISNYTEDDDKTEFAVTAKSSGGIALETDASAKLNVPNATERMWKITSRADSVLGPADISVTTTNGAFGANGIANMSVRPTTPFTTDIQMGTLNEKKTTIRTKNTDMYADSASHMLYISYGADALVRPLVEYLNKYEWNCTEQMTSRAIPYVAIGASDILGITYDTAAKKVADTIATLKNRQNDDGSFAMWAGGNTGRDNENNTRTAYVTAYVVQFLNLARDRGFDVPREMTARALDYLRTYAGTTINSIPDADAHAFAIYVVTANEYVTTAYIGQFEEWANANHKDWESKLSGQYIAAAYAIMHQDERAAALASKYKTEDAIKYTSEFDNTVANNGWRQYLATKYLGYGAATPSRAQIKYINAGEYSSFTAAALILGNAAGMGATNKVSDAVTVTVDGAPLSSDGKSGPFVAALPADATKIDISCPDCGSSMNLYWTTVRQGYPKSVSAQARGMDIVREYYDMDGNKITNAGLGDRVQVKISVRARGDVKNVPGAVIVDILPGGFIADSETISGDYNFAEVREDRVVIYTDVTREESTYSYTAQAGAAGTFTIAPIHAAAMYNPGLTATGHDGTFTVTNESND
ncbi:MAG: hypothetical protein K2L25_01740 [Alphaproteobacteria bacterium]|nr:hypothetical protein [Alphaproteobacteria bacterium]